MANILKNLNISVDIDDIVMENVKNMFNQGGDAVPSFKCCCSTEDEDEPMVVGGFDYTMESKTDSENLGGIFYFDRESKNAMMHATTYTTESPFIHDVKIYGIIDHITKQNGMYFALNRTDGRVYYSYNARKWNYTDNVDQSAAGGIAFGVGSMLKHIKYTPDTSKPEIRKDAYVLTTKNRNSNVYVSTDLKTWMKLSSPCGMCRMAYLGEFETNRHKFIMVGSYSQYIYEAVMSYNTAAKQFESSYTQIVDLKTDRFYTDKEGHAINPSYWGNTQAQGSYYDEQSKTFLVQYGHLQDYSDVASVIYVKANDDGTYDSDFVKWNGLDSNDKHLSRSDFVKVNGRYVCCSFDKNNHSVYASESADKPLEFKKVMTVDSKYNVKKFEQMFKNNGNIYVSGYHNDSTESGFIGQLVEKEGGTFDYDEMKIVNTDGMVRSFFQKMAQMTA